MLRRNGLPASDLSARKLYRPLLFVLDSICDSLAFSIALLGPVYRSIWDDFNPECTVTRTISF